MSRGASGRREALVTIRSLGRNGDGIADWGGRRCFVPFTLPGERWRVALESGGKRILRGRPLECLSATPRREPLCRHFGRCGGCRLQHLPDELYLSFKLERIRSELRNHRIAVPPFDPPALSPPGSRRRLRLAFERKRGRLRLGFRRPRSHVIEPLRECPIACPRLAALFEPLAELLGAFPGFGGGGEISLTRIGDGVDMLLDLPESPGLAEREALAEFAARWNVSRLSIRSHGVTDPVVVRRLPRMRLGPLEIVFPEGAFRQATRQGEEALRAFVGDALRPGMRVVDLFAGLGVLTLECADRLDDLLLVERDPAAIDALRDALRRAGGSRIRVALRDLAKEPLQASELDGFGLAVLDPPRSGAATQIREIARARIDRLVYVSCHPPSFARDAAGLQQAGFRLERLLPVDQFLWSAEVELAALFLRGGTAAR